MTAQTGSGGTSEASRKFDVAIHGARDSAFLIGDHGAINTPQGTRVIRSIGSEAVAAPRLRPLPVGLRPDRPAPFFGRAAERELGARVAPGSPLQFHGAVGVGKSTLFKELAFDVPPGDDGVVHA